MWLKIQQVKSVGEREKRRAERGIEISGLVISFSHLFDGIPPQPDDELSVREGACTSAVR